MASTMVVVGLVGLVATGSPAAADVTAVSGSATALSIGGTATASVSGAASQAAAQDGYGPIGSGFLPSGVSCPSGSTAAPLNLPVLLSLGLLDACTRGADLTGDNHLGFAESSAAVANVVIGGAPLGVVRSACRADGNGAVGSSEIIGSGIPGLPTNPAPNTVVGVPGILPLGQILTLTLNEQVVINTPGTASITVNAVRLTLLGINIVLSQSSCEATGPDVNVTTTSSTTPPTSGPGASTTTSTTTGGGGGGGGGGGDNTNNNVNNNPNNSVNNNPNNNVNNNISNNTNTLTGGNNVNTNTVGGNNINITTPPAQIVFLTQGQDQHQQQAQHQSGAVVHTGALARTGWSALEPLGAMSGVSLVIGMLMMIMGRSPAAAAAGSYRLDVPVRWGPAEVGRAIVGAAVSLFVSATNKVLRRNG